MHGGVPPTALGGLLKRIDSFNLSTFDGRLVLQKTVHLMQSCGVPLGYEFSWYVRGPYSPGLTRDAFEIQGSYSSMQPARFADPALEARFAAFVDFIRPHKLDARWLELVASIDFLTRLGSESDKDGVYAIVAGKMPGLTPAEFEKGWIDHARMRRMFGMGLA